MTNRYEEAAREIEAQIEELEARLARFEARGLSESRLQSVRNQIEELKSKPIGKWRATGKWVKELWG